MLCNTRAGARYGHDDYIHSGCGFGREATLWFTERGVRVVGTDGWSWDAPFSYTLKRWQETRDPSIIWEGHKAGMVRGYCQIEKLGNLERAAGGRVHRVLLPGQGEGRVGRLDPRRRDLRIGGRNDPQPFLRSFRHRASDGARRHGLGVRRPSWSPRFPRRAGSARSAATT